MREQFSTLNDIFGYYRFLKLKLGSCPSNFPDSDLLRCEIKKYDPVFQRSAKEDCLAFIGDVENFIKYFYKEQNNYFPIPLNCLYLIFLQKFCSDISKFKSYGHLAQYFYKQIKRGVNLPRRLKYRQHLHDIGDEMWDKAEKYFKEKGYL